MIRKYGKYFAIGFLSVATILGSLIFWQISSTSAHTNTDHSADCTGVTGTFWGFDAGTTAVTFTGARSVVKTFTGAEDVTFNLSATWVELGVDVTRGGTPGYSFSWSVHGGNPTPETFYFAAEQCVPVITTTTTVPSTTTTTVVTPPPPTPPTPPVAPPAVPTPRVPTFTG